MPALRVTNRLAQSKAVALDAFVLPGNNYHVYDITLFWANIRADFERRGAAWLKRRG